MTLRNLAWAPLTADRLPDFETLFGPRGACAGCWCMLWRRSPRTWREGQGDGNRAAMRELVRSGSIPGILQYSNDVPIGWCSVAPREAFPGLARSRVLRPIDDERVWSVTCLFVSRAWRRKGVSVALLQAAAEYLASMGGGVLEGYPQSPRSSRMPDAFAWTGLASAYVTAGFEEAGRHTPGRPIMRRRVAPSHTGSRGSP